MPSTPSEPGADHGLSIPHEDWERTPASVRTLVSRQQEIIAELLKRIEELEARTGRNSQNSNRPPSSDAPHQRVKRKKSKAKKKPGAKKGHEGHQQALLEPTGPVPPAAFSYHWGEYAACEATVKASVPEGSTTGYGARFTALVGELSGAQRSSCRAVKDFCPSALDLFVSVGAIEKCVDRVSQAIVPYDEKIADRARSTTVNPMDETARFQHGGVGLVLGDGQPDRGLFPRQSKPHHRGF